MWLYRADGRGDGLAPVEVARFGAELHAVARAAGLPAAPRVVLLVEDAGVLGSPFYLMERRRGTIVRTSLPAEYAAMPDAPG